MIFTNCSYKTVDHLILLDKPRIILVEIPNYPPRTWILYREKPSHVNAFNASGSEIRFFMR